MWNKRGVSAIVATVLIVLITIAAASILFTTIVPFVKNSLSSSTECLPYKTYIQFEKQSGYTCYDANNLTGFTVRVSAPSDGSDALERFDVAFSANLSLRRASVVDQADVNNGIEGVRMLDKTVSKISVAKIGEVQTYVYNAGAIRPAKIEVYPILKSGKICEKSDEVSLTSCKGVNL